VWDFALPIERRVERVLDFQIFSRKNRFVRAKSKSNSVPRKAFSEPQSVESFDWRLQAITTTTTDTALGSKVMKAGAVVMAIAQIRYDSKTINRFALPSVCALMLDFAKQMYDQSCDLPGLLSGVAAIELRQARNFPVVFEMLERRMAAVIFSFTALEAFANEVIANAYGRGYTYGETNATGANVPLTLEDVERRAPLDLKLNTILPQIFSVRSPKGTYNWENFKRLKKIRDRIVHNKQIDRLQSMTKDETLWRFLTDSDFKNFPLHAKGIIAYFWQTIDGDRTARWYEKMPW
jgi:hypothetical protein